MFPLLTDNDTLALSTSMIYALSQTMLFFFNSIFIFQEKDLLILGEIHDVRLLGSITAMLLLTIAMLSLTCVIRPRSAGLFPET